MHMSILSNYGRRITVLSISKILYGDLSSSKFKIRGIFEKVVGYKEMNLCRYLNYLHKLKM